PRHGPGPAPPPGESRPGAPALLRHRASAPSSPAAVRGPPPSRRPEWPADWTVAPVGARGSRHRRRERTAGGGGGVGAWNRHEKAARTLPALAPGRPLAADVAIVPPSGAYEPPARPSE